MNFGSKKFALEEVPLLWIDVEKMARRAIHGSVSLF